MHTMLIYSKSFHRSRRRYNKLKTLKLHSDLNVDMS